MNYRIPIPLYKAFINAREPLPAVIEQPAWAKMREFFTHRDVNPSKTAWWTCSDGVSGHKVGFGATRELAMAKAVAHLKTKTLDEFDSMIERKRAEQFDYI